MVAGTNFGHCARCQLSVHSSRRPFRALQVLGNSQPRVDNLGPHRFVGEYARSDSDECPVLIKPCQEMIQAPTRQSGGQMLVLSRKKLESILISEGIIVTVLEIGRNSVRLGITAPKEIPIHRSEILELRSPIAGRPPTDSKMPHTKQYTTTLIDNTNRTDCIVGELDAAQDDDNVLEPACSYAARLQEGVIQTCDHGGTLLDQPNCSPPECEPI